MAAQAAGIAAKLRALPRAAASARLRSSIDSCRRCGKAAGCHAACCVAGGLTRSWAAILSDDRWIACRSAALSSV